MKTVMLFARDPGGANVIMPVYDKFKTKYRTLVYAKEFALKKFRDNGILAEDIEEECNAGTYGDVKSFLKRHLPDLVITGTSLDDFTERYLWKAAEELQIKSFAILDQWTNLGIRFSSCDYSREEEYQRQLRHPYLPYRIFAMDELAKRMLEEDGIESDKIILSGQPHFDTVRDRFLHASRVYPGDRWNVVFVSEPIYQDYDVCNGGKLYWGYNERTIFDSLYRCLETAAECCKCKIRLIIRPHPRENPGYWNEVMKKRGSDDIVIDIDTTNDSFSVMKSADFICGMSSMFLLESMICGKTVLSIEIGLKRDNPFILDKTGYCKSILSEGELIDHLKRAFSRKDGGEGQDTEEGAYRIGYPKGVENATDKILQSIEEEIAE